eukprot:6184032-Pleurochrysis_carterae.AAC.2
MAHYRTYGPGGRTQSFPSTSRAFPGSAHPKLRRARGWRTPFSSRNLPARPACQQTCRLGALWLGQCAS